MILKIYDESFYSSLPAPSLKEGHTIFRMIYTIFRIKYDFPYWPLRRQIGF